MTNPVVWTDVARKIARQPATFQDRSPLPDRMTAGGAQGVGREGAMLGLKFLEANDIGLRSGERRLSFPARLLMLNAAIFKESASRSDSSCILV